MTREISEAAPRSSAKPEDASATLLAHSDVSELNSLKSNATDLHKKEDRNTASDTSGHLEFTSLPLLRDKPPVTGANASVRFNIDGTSHELSDGTGNEPAYLKFDLGLFGIENSAPRISPEALQRVSETGRFGADVQSTVVGREVGTDLPLASQYLRRDAANDIRALTGAPPSGDLPNQDKVKPPVSVDASSAALPIDQNGKPDLTVKSENRFSANPEQFNVLDARRNLPPSWNADGAADYILNSLSDKINRDSSAEQYSDGRGNLRSKTEIRSNSGNVETDVSVSNQDEINKIRLLIFSIQSSDHKDFPKAIVDVANQFRFNADCMHALQLAEKEKDPMVRKATELAIVEQQLKQYGTKYFNIAWDEAEKIPLKTSPEQEQANSKERVEKALADLRTHDLAQKLGPQPNPPMKQTELAGQGLSDAEKATAAKLYASLFTRDEYLRNVGRAKYSW